MSELNVYCDGSVTKPRYGDAVSAWCILDEDLNEISCGAEFVRRGTEDATVNVAEYSAVILALSDCSDTIWEGVNVINVRTDSQLIVRQINGEYQCNNVVLKELLSKCLMYINDFKDLGITVNVEWISRKENLRADSLSKSLYIKEK